MDEALATDLETKVEINCFICNQESTDSDLEFSYLVDLHCKYSKTKVLDKISKLIGKNFAVVFTDQDILCHHCLDLFNIIDHLEIQIEQNSKILIQNIIEKYNLEKDEEIEPICEKPISEERLKDRNKESHTVCKDYSCLQCGKFLGNNFEELRKHIKEHPMFVCRHCSHPFSNYFRFKMHVYKCKMSSEISRMETIVADESVDPEPAIDGTNSPELSQLSSDSKVVQEKGQIKKEPVAKETLKTIYLCQICNYETDVDSEMKLHIDLHTKYEYKCDKCGAGFKTPHNLELHEHRHITGSIPTKCNICGVECVDKLHLRVHKQKVHALHLTCSICGFVAKTKSEFIAHKKRHENHTKLQCEVRIAIKD